MTNRDVAIKQILSHFNKLSVASINIKDIEVDPYLDALETLVSGFDWKAASWADRIKILIQFAKITSDFYTEFMDEDDDAQRVEALTEITYTGWLYIKEKYEIKLPTVLMTMMAIVGWNERRVITTLFEAVMKFLHKPSEPVAVTA